MEQITVTVEGIIYRNDDNGYTVAEIDMNGQFSTAVGMISALCEGERVRLTGEWTSHSQYGEQFKVHICEPLPPSSREGLVRYLSSGIIPGVGKVTAQRVVDAFGIDALDIIRQNPSVLSAVEGIGASKAHTIALGLTKQIETQETMVFLQSLQLSLGMAMRIYKTYGQASIEVVQSDPYRLVSEIEGIGFRTADQIANAMGFSPDTPQRMEAGIRHLLLEAAQQQGHTYLPETQLLESAAVLLGSDADTLEIALVSLLRQRAVVVRVIDGVDCIFLPWLHGAEMEVARRLSHLVQAPIPPLYADLDAALDDTAKLAGVRLSDEQRQAVAAALSGGVTVITGGPGTGKTTTLHCILSALEQVRCNVFLAAPTGRAAKRMSEATQREAKTIHRLLEYAFEGNDSFGSFLRDDEHPLECDALIVDEMSMVDIQIMQHLVRALSPGCRLILVGDVDQLPSVGAGNVLRDIIASGVANVERLTQIFRQKQESLIVVNAHKVNHGEYPDLWAKNGDFFFERQNDASSAAASVDMLITRRLTNYLGCDPIRDIQVLTPMKKGELGVYALNTHLQSLLNPPSPGKAEHKQGDAMLFRVGDKVMQTKNNYQLEWSRESEDGKGVFNGDMGLVAAIQKDMRILTVAFDDGRVANYDFIQLIELELAYAITVHKSQGSEFPVVILPLVQGPPMLMARNLLYTAITRARRMVMIVGRERCIQGMVDNNRIIERYSGLPHAFLMIGGVQDGLS